MTDNQIITEISDCFVEITRDENGFFVANWSPEIQTYKTIDELYSDFLPILKEAQKVGGEWQEEIDYIENAPAARWFCWWILISDAGAFARLNQIRW